MSRAWFSRAVRRAAGRDDGRSQGEQADTSLRWRRLHLVVSLPLIGPTARSRATTEHIHFIGCAYSFHSSPKIQRNLPRGNVWFYRKHVYVGKWYGRQVFVSSGFMCDMRVLLHIRNPGMHMYDIRILLSIRAEAVLHGNSNRSVVRVRFTAVANL